VCVVRRPKPCPLLLPLYLLLQAPCKVQLLLRSDPHLLLLPLLLLPSIHWRI
jgi:hypothetical protein